MKDYIVRATAANGQIRAFAANTTAMVEESRRIHNTSPIVTEALGKLLTAGAMMGTMMKNDSDVVTIQIQCQGPIEDLTVTADSKANVKGYAKNPQVMLPLDKSGHLDVKTALGLGVLTVIKDIGMKEPYTGQTILMTSEVADDLTYYFATSEQVPSSVGLGVHISKDNVVEQAGGFIIQLMPDATEETIAALEQKIREVKSVTAMLKDGLTPEDMLQKILGELGVTILDEVDTKYQCNCSKERVAKAIMSIGKSDIQSMIDDGKPIEVNCHFCNTNYTFNIDELKAMIQ